MPDDIQLRRSKRLNPGESLEHHLELTLIPEEELAVSSDSADSDGETNRTIVEPFTCDDGLQISSEMDDIRKLLEDMRLQLDSVTASAESEKQERIRLQELLSRQQQTNAPITAVVTIPTSSSYSAVVSNVCSLSTTAISTTATTTSMCSGAGLVQHPQCSWTPTTTYMPSQTYQSAYVGPPQVANSTYSYTPRVPTFMPVQPFGQYPFMQMPSMPTPSSNAAGPSSSISNHGFGNGRKLHDLPDFNGRPEDWPMFSTAYRESTAMFGYSNVENIFRLQKCIKGSAREVVEALLIHPNNVDQVLSALEFRFGRPETLVRSQLAKVREIAPITDGKLELLIPFATKVQNLATFLESSGMYQHLANPTLMDELVSKLPMSKRLEWAQRSMYIQPYATIRHFEEWLTALATLVCLVVPTSTPQINLEAKAKTRSVLHAVKHITPTAVTSNQKCYHCKGDMHPVAKCPTYIDLDVFARWKLVKKQRLCFCCLKFGHSVRTCRLRNACGTDGCERMHHSSLHEAGEAKISSDADKSGTDRVEKAMLGRNIGTSDKILFRVLPVRLYGDGVVVRTHALLDEGSSITIMSAELAGQLHLTGYPKDLKLQWISKETFTNESFVVDLKISADVDGAETFSMEGVQTVNELSLPTQTLIAADLPPSYAASIFSTLPFTEYENASPQILIGLDNCHLGAPIRVVKSADIGPVVTETKLGCVVYGKSPIEDKDVKEGLVLHCGQVEDDDDQHLTRIVDDFFSIENFGVKKPSKNIISAADKRALHILTSTTKNIKDRYQTGLLWKNDNVELPDSYEMAQRRLWNLESRFLRDPDFAATYRSIISSYLQKGYARRLTHFEAKESSPRTWYLPHFGVKNPNKPTKVRLVFDAAAKVRGVSLNSFLLKGPDENQPLLTILFNFRLKPVAVTGDIKEMFHQVLIRKEDQDSQRFLWREDKDNPIEVYVMQSMTFGASCSPCSANFIKNNNAKRFSNVHPRAVKAILDRHYVDDYVDCFDSVAEAIEVTKAVTSIHLSGGFELRNFTSSSREVLRAICELSNEEQQQQSRSVDMNVEAGSEKVLGMCWEPDEDVYVFKLKFPRISSDVMICNRRPTKREFLAIAMSVFDPYGMIANFLLYVKLLLQSIWRCGVQWDEPIPHEFHEKWCQWKAELPALKYLKVPRCHDHNLSTARSIVLHTFVDASEEAFSAVSYLRIDHGDRISVSFVCGKTKCAPQKLMSIPRLELSAAVLGTRLCDSILKCHDLAITDQVYWTDSKTVHSWFRSDPRRHKPFVGFRIAEVLDSSKISQWRWIPTKLNSADEGTRARYPAKFQVDNKWIMGPSFLQLPEDKWPEQPDDIGNQTCQEEIKSKYLLHASSVSTSVFDLSRFSTYSKLRRTAAWVIRFIKLSLRKSSERGELSAKELDDAERVLCSEAQSDVFMREITQLGCEQQVDKSSSIHKLTPYIDEEGLLRVYGRIDAAATIPFTARRPIILPKGHQLTKLIVTDFHRRLRHQNDDTVTNEIRNKFWVPSLRSAVKKARNDCQFCRVRSALPLPPLMGQLPVDRVTPYVRPFTYTGLDYFGPVTVTVGRHKEKRWVALFTCLTVRAVHLELAANLSTDACILCIRNFINRRGIPVRIRSDNGTNFVGTKNELLSANIFDGEAIKAELSGRGIEWIFNCPSNPHAGGCWERLVRSVKRVLSHTLNQLAPRTETLLSALIEAENIVNSRPLTHLPVSTEDEEPLTPNHFLVGSTSSTQTPGNFDERELCLRKQWRISRQIKDRFWRRWMREYLPELTKRSKWFAIVPPLKVGDLVLICDADVPRRKWMRGKVTSVFPGPDGQIRVADVKTTTGILRRPAVKLAVLEVGEAGVERGASRGVEC